MCNEKIPVHFYVFIFTKFRWIGCTFSRSSSGPACSKLTMLLVNVSLKFQTLLSQICQYFLLEKCEKLLQCKSFSHFFNKKYQCIWLWSCKHLTSWPLNELVKLTMLWTTGPLYFHFLLLSQLGLTSGCKFFLLRVDPCKGFVVQGPVVQSIISLMSLLRNQLVKCFTTLLPNKLKFLLKKCEKLLQCKSFSLLFNK